MAADAQRCVHTCTGGDVSRCILAGMVLGRGERGDEWDRENCWTEAAESTEQDQTRRHGGTEVSIQWESLRKIQITKCFRVSPSPCLISFRALRPLRG